MIDGFRDELFRVDRLQDGRQLRLEQGALPRARADRRPHPREPRDGVGRRGRRRLVPGRPEVDRRGRGRREARLRGRVGRAACCELVRPPAAYPRSRSGPDRAYPRRACATRTRITEQRRALPDSPGVYIFRDAQGQGPLRRQGALDPQARGRPLLEAGRPRGDATWSPRSPTSTSSPPRPRPRRCSPSRSSSSATGRVFNVRLRDDKSYPYIGISLDEDFPRIYFTRERHRRNRAYFGPFCNAKRVRETLDLLGKVFQYRTCDGPEPGRASRQPLPRLLHQALPGALRRLHLEGGVPRERRDDHRLPLGPLPPDREGARPGDEAGGRASRSSSRRRSSATS